MLISDQIPTPLLVLTTTTRLDFSNLLYFLHLAKNGKLALNFMYTACTARMISLYLIINQGMLIILVTEAALQPSSKKELGQGDQ